MDDIETPVLVVGGGPAGLTTALSLAQRGIEPLLIERRDFTQHFPRAHLLNVRTMEIFRDLGVADDIYARSAPETGWQRVAWYTSLGGPTPLHGRKIGHISAWGGGADTERYASASPRRFTNLPQIYLDRILWEHAEAHSPGRIRPRQELVALATDAAGATATVLDRDSDRRYQIRARYVVAADGGRTAAGLLGVPMRGVRSLVDVVSLYVRMDLSQYADEEALLTYFVSPDDKATVPGALLSLAPRLCARDSAEWTVSIKYRIDDPASQDTDAAVARLRQMLGLPDLKVEVKAVGHWQYEGVVAAAFRIGSVFLAGDAAHRHPPTGGLGLNLAVQDAGNLGWKLAAVLKGQAGPGLLDTFEQERRPVAVHCVEHSLRNAGRHAPIGRAMGLRPEMTAEEGWREVAVWASDTPAGRQRRRAVEQAVAANADDYSQLNIEAGYYYESAAIVPDGTPVLPTQESATQFVPTARPGYHVPHAWLRSDSGQISSVDLVAPEGLTLFAFAEDAAEWDTAEAARAAGCPVTVVCVAPADPDGKFRELCSVTPGGAVLVRPDKHVCWRTAQRPADPHATLTHVMREVRNGAAADGSLVQTRISGIVDAGDVLRTGDRGPARVFESN